MELKVFLEGAMLPKIRNAMLLLDYRHALRYSIRR